MKTCSVCGSMLPAFNHESVCTDEACRQFKMLYELRPPKTEMERKIYAFQVEKTRINIARKKIEQAKKEQALQVELVRREQENEAYRRALINKRPDLANHPWFTLPSGHNKLTNLPARRRRIFRDFLNKLIGQLYSKRKQEITVPVKNADSSNLLDLQKQFCTVCQGGCCTNGSNNAYLSVETLLRYGRSNPQYRPRHVLAAYLDRIPEKSYADSCIYHTQSGCNLPREMRSDTCNQFLCSPVTRFCRQVKGEKPVDEVLVLVRRQDLWRQTQLELDNRLIGAYLLEENKIKPLSST